MSHGTKTYPCVNMAHADKPHRRAAQAKRCDIESKEKVEK